VGDLDAAPGPASADPEAARVIQIRRASPSACGRSVLASGRVNSSLRAALSALLLVSSASAQVSAPSLVEEDLAPADEAPATPARQPKGDPEPMMPPRWEKEALKGAAPARDAKPAGTAAAGSPSTPAAAPASAPPANANPAATGTQATTAPQAANPAAPPTPAAPVQESLVRPIQPVRSSLSDLRQAWTARRKALREQDVAGAEEAERRIVVLQQELGIESLRPFAVAEIRDAQRALAARLDADAEAHAALAVKLAPGLPEAHLALARARFAREPSRPGPVLASLGRAALAAAQDPYTLRATAADVAVALLAAVLAAGAAAVLVLLLRRLPLFLHDFHDLPLVRAGTPVQAGLLALALLLLPLALGLGPLATLAVAASAAWLYLRLSERLVVTVAFLAFLAAPLAAEHGARLAAFSGTIAQEIWEVEHGPGEEAAASLVARGEEKLPAAALAALGGHAKRRGDLEEARRWYDRALEAGGRGPEALVNLGNVHMLRGDPDAAKAAWLDAADRAGPNLDALAAAQLNLSKLYVRQVSLEQAQEARRRASQASPSLVARHASEEDMRANRWLVDAPVPMSAYTALAVQDPAPAALGAAVRAWLAGALPSNLWPWAPLGLLALLWLSVLGDRRLRPSRACEKCGRPACARCDGATGLLCGQCVNVFVKKGVVEGRDRLKKDQQVRRHVRFGRILARAGAIAGGGPGYLLHDAPWRGFVVLGLLFFAAFLALVPGGVLPPPQPSPAASALRLGAAIVLGAAVYLIAVRDLFRRTRG